MPPAASPSPDVVIVGAGVIGAACAERLCRAGLRVLVLDRGRAGEATTAAGGGMISLQTKRPGPHLRLARRSRELLFDLEARLGTEIGLRWCGSMTVARAAGELAALEARADAQRQDGVPVDLIDGLAAREMESELAPDVCGAAVCGQDGQVDPPLLCGALLAAARTAGAEVAEKEPAVALERCGDRITGVRTPGRQVSAGAVVVAAGPWSSELLAPLDPAWRARVVPRRGVLLRSAPRPSFVRHLLLDAGYYGQKAGAGRSLAFSLQQTWDGRLLLGGTRAFSGFTTGEATMDERHGIRAHGKAILPSLARVPFLHATVGLRPWTPDSLPLVGPSGSTGLWLATGHEGDGVALAPVTAEILAHGLLGAPADADAAALDPRRFAEAGRP